MSSSIARVPTANGSRYLQQLAKHWSHNLDVEFTAKEGRVVFPKDARGAAWAADGRLRMAAGPDALECTVEGSSAEHVEALKAVVARHLDRFAFREAPLAFDWRDEAEA